MSARALFLLIFLICATVLGVALYLQNTHYLLPCPLCVVQRYFYWGAGLVALLAAVHWPAIMRRQIYAGLTGLLSLAGLGTAGRHLWVIEHPESTAGCSISPLEVFLNNLPSTQLWPGMFEANGDCADASWTLLTLTIPAWSALTFALLTALTGYLLINARRP